MTLSLPDISSESTPLTSSRYSLDWVGMENIALPVRIENTLCQSQINAYVSLDDPLAKGIHMSRLYTRLLELTSIKNLSLFDIKHVLKDFLESHKGLSTHAKIEIHSELYIERAALISHLSGWKSYPFVLSCQLLQDQFEAKLKVEIPYSSTCPCSAALSRNIIQQRFLTALAHQEISLDQQQIVDWLNTTDAIAATPHSQRSFAILHFKLDQNIKLIPLILFINQAEQSLMTPVQTAVKRIDEQAFAVANGQNLMFCEDALRRLYGTFLQHKNIKGFNFKVIHAESLHAHDAVAQGSWQW
ncbi:GTP cyclohydrolase FolE2 [Acinetobacter sp. NIPH 2699]|uniref:GTP cyclohydrolase FolE2 n=1 Tax=Acinetobacter sp. NIPH 2699 TaxID=2923433 RepID=UPI001F4AC92D|nr:GTP cyclohydrolase FolE2 [Acinetobacter sp. NIPH 2699]MCH7337167.1 GTP cyclohydrolase FolE2 [Acinetobacter sp. NIPH 2699]